MYARMKTALGRIPWGLAGKAALAATAWLYAPPWLWVAVVFILYFFPFFRPLELAIPFLYTLGLAAVLPRAANCAESFSIPLPGCAIPLEAWVGAGLVATLFFFILGIKDLTLIDRVGGYELVVTLLGLTFGFAFFRAFPAFDTPLAVFLVLTGGFLLFRQFARFAGAEAGDGTANSRALTEHRALVSAGVGAFLLTEWAWVLLLLPLTAVFQAALFFLAVTVLAEFVRGYLRGGPTRTDALANLSLFLVCTVILLAANQWGV